MLLCNTERWIYFAKPQEYNLVWKIILGEIESDLQIANVFVYAYRGNDLSYENQIYTKKKKKKICEIAFDHVQNF